jgi:hypothetical protein
MGKNTFFAMMGLTCLLSMGLCAATLKEPKRTEIRKNDLEEALTIGRSQGKLAAYEEITKYIGTYIDQRQNLAEANKNPGDLKKYGDQSALLLEIYAGIVKLGYNIDLQHK